MNKLPKGTEAYAGFVAGVVATAALAYFFWKSQIPPPADG
jgi:hypothetical protein